MPMSSVWQPLPMLPWRMGAKGRRGMGIHRRPPPSCCKGPVLVASATSGAGHPTPQLQQQLVYSGFPQHHHHPPTSGGVLALEEKIEKLIYRCRFFTFMGVLGSLMGSILCFLKGCLYVMNSFAEYLTSAGPVTLMLVEAIDMYLIGTVMFVFGMGLYELFISNLDIAKASSYGSSLLGLFKLPERPKWLEIQSVNELKTKLGHVIVLVLLVGMVEKSKIVAISSSKDLLCFAASILVSSGCLYLLSKLHFKKHSKHA